MAVAAQYRMPAEWEPHASTWLAWPHRTSDWPGKFGPIRPVYAEIIRTLSRYEFVNVVVADSTMRVRATKLLNDVDADLTNVKFHIAPTNRSWVRDSGAIFVKNGKANIALDWHFNAWAKYPDWPLDEALPEHMAGWLKMKRLQPKFGKHRIVLEGGSIDVNGTGRMLTTEECLLSKIQERNPSMNRADYEAVLKQYLGINEVIWLNKGIAGDDTHGHVDDLARFVSEKTVVTVVEHNEADENFEPLMENLTRLKAVKGIEVVPLPMPAPLYMQGVRLPASYANFYIANGVVIVPTFNDPADRIALGILAEVFPTRTVVGIHCVDLVWGLGTLHCMTQQEPR
jgi:agmatine deiminase